MTDNKFRVLKGDLADGDRDIAADERIDGELEQLVKRAYEGADPTPEQESRMLAALQEAQRDGGRLGEMAGDAALLQELDGVSQRLDEMYAPANPMAGAPDAGKAAAVQPRPNRTRGVRSWMIALPVAACLIVGAIAVGVGSFSPVQMSNSKEGIAQTSPSEPDSATAVTTQGATEAIEEEYALEDRALTNGLMATSDVEEIVPPDGGVEPGEGFNTEEYNTIEERGFVSTKTSPLSTVSADVDTASYCNLRRMLNDGFTLEDVPTGAVRIEEMLNYFNYDYPAPQGDDKFSITAQAAPCPWNADTQLLVLGFASASETKAADKGSNLVFLVDVSGSMASPDKLDLLQDSFATLLAGLDANDRVSIVTYANGEEIVLEGATGDNDAEILRAIYKLRADGSTNGEAGLRQAYEVAERNFIEGGVNRIIMASDGDLNVGMSSESELHDFVDKKRESGIYLSVLGFGSGNYKDNKMETVADHGNGSYHYIDCIDEAKRVLEENLTANLVPFADNVKVQLEFNPAQVKGYRLIGYDNRVLAAEDFRDDAVDAGDVGPNAQFTVAYEVVLADSPFPVTETELKYGESAPSYDSASGDWLTCTMRYHVFDGDEMREQQQVVDASSVASDPSADWKFAASVIEFGMIARDSKYVGTSSIDSALGLIGNELSDERAGFKELVEKARGK